MIYTKYKSNLKETSRDLRKNLTEAEKLLWSKIRRRQINSFQFYRQRPILNYVVDFYCPVARLAIEIDGGQHFEERNIIKDKIRDEELRKLNIKILRFTKLDVLRNIDSVIGKIEENLL